MKVHAQGDTYNGVYNSRSTPYGWCFVEKGGTFLTPGIGRSMYYSTESELFQKVKQYRGIKIKVMTQ